MAVTTHKILEIIRHPEVGLVAVAQDAEHKTARSYLRLDVTAGGMVVARQSDELRDLSRTELADLEAEGATALSVAGIPRDGLAVSASDPTTGYSAEDPRDARVKALEEQLGEISQQITRVATARDEEIIALSEKLEGSQRNEKALQDQLEATKAATAAATAAGDAPPEGESAGKEPSGDGNAEGGQAKSRRGRSS